MTDILRIGALISGGGTNLQAIIDACESGAIDGKVVFVGSDQPGVKGLERAKKAQIPSFVVDYGEIIRNKSSYDLPEDLDLEDVIDKQNIFTDESRLENAASYFAIRSVAERMLLDKMEEFSCDLLVLAGFMRILTPYFIDRFKPGSPVPTVMNIHPALLPAFPGVDGYGDTFAYGCKVGGCTVHFVDYGEDSGPIIGQKAYTIEPDDTEASIRKKGLELEWLLYPECIQLFAHDRLRMGVRGTRRVVEIV